MTLQPFTKHYATPEQATAAVRHYAWLQSHGQPFALPDLLAAEPNSLHFEQITGRHALPEDLPHLAQLLGSGHAAAWADELHRARLDQDWPVPGGHLADYLHTRRSALRRRLKQGHLDGPGQLAALLDLLERTAQGPVAFYKDSNPRNFLITAGEVFAVDFDDLTLAPFGYDLAKLIHTLTLAHGPLAPGLTNRALDRYNHGAAAQGPGHDITLAEVTGFLELHDALTAPYRDRPYYPHAPLADQPRRNR